MFGTGATEAPRRPATPQAIHSTKKKPLFARGLMLRAKSALVQALRHDYSLSPRLSRRCASLARLLALLALLRRSIERDPQPVSIIGSASTPPAEGHE
jgi:hypothetical protein